MSYRSSLLASLLAAALYSAAAPVWGQPADPAPPPPNDEHDGEAATELDEVLVVARRPDIITAADRMIYAIGDDLQAQTGSVADVLRNVPGVEVDLQGNVSLRGDGNVTILIDGRPSAVLRGASRADVLQAMAGAQIERVEVMTNPSAAFSPEGSGGVINLITRAQSPAARTASLRASWDGDDQGNLSFSGSRAEGALTVAGDLGLRRSTGDGRTERERQRNGDGGETVAETSLFDSRNENSSGNGRFSVDYDLSARDRLSGELSFRGWEGENRSNESFERTSDDALTDRILRDQNGAFDNTNAEARLSWRRKFDDDQHELVADFEAETGGSNRSQEVRSRTLAGGEPAYLQRFRSKSDDESFSAEIDYTRPLGEGRLLRLGYEGEVEREDYRSVGQRGPSEGSLAPVPSLTNAFDYEEWVHAAYATYERPFGDLDFQGGLRLEQVSFDLTVPGEAIAAGQDYFRAYPTVNFGYQLTDGQRLRGGYSRRISRPGPNDLNPFVVYLDPQNLRQGNPDLEPEITDSFELGWQLRQGRTFYSVTGFYRDSAGGITDVVQDVGDGVFLTTRQNLSSSERLGAEFIANGRLGSQLSYNVSGSVFRSEIETPGLGKRSGTMGMARASLNWQPTDNDFFQVNGFWSGEQVQSQGVRDPFGILNLGYRRKINDNFSLVLTGNNVLDSGEITRTVQTADFRERSRNRFNQPTYYIGFTYSLGGGRRQEPTFDFGQQGAPG